MTTQEKRTRSLTFMRQSEQWPAWPYCPLKRRNADDTAWECGYLLQGDGPVIYFGNIFNPKPSDPSRDYDTFDAIVADGWMVD